ncbi:MAG: xanthine dehydrogenase small subunit [Saccharospirillum sp.]
MTTLLLNRQMVSLASVPADQTLLNFLRQNQRLTGTKEGCASGDCGACTVVVAEPSEGRLRYRAINSCITLVHSLSGKQVLTVEHLAQGDRLHPVQAAMVEHHGSQCGFCTPGFVMSLFALYHSGATAERSAVIKALSGNLCRCTGYRPIIDAGLAALTDVKPDAFDHYEASTLAQLSEIETGVLPKDSKPDQSVHFWQPKDRAALARTLAHTPEAHLCAGSTDLALEKTQQLKTLAPLIDLTRVAELRRVEVTNTEITLGAAVTYSELATPLLAEYPEAEEWLERLGSTPIRNRGTLGGNLGTASPIGDGPPLLLALDASLSLGSAKGLRRLPLSDFFTGYRRTALEPGEWIDAIHLPRRQPGSRFRVYKISKRFEDDISTVCAAFYLELDEAGKVRTFRAGFGGLAATPLQLPHWQDRLLHQSWADLDISPFAQALSDELTPLSDVRASARYRQRVSANLLRRFHLETTGAGATRAQPMELSHA